MITKNKVENRLRLKTHIRMRVTGTSERPRLTVFRSLKHVYMQLVDDTTGKTILSVSDIDKDVRDEFKELKGQLAKGKRVGALAAKKALEKNIAQVVFDRNGYLYHGRVKAL
ncbi:MAG: 50S ribosomal protein L18, partial [Bacteroidota bacterium]